MRLTAGILAAFAALVSVSPSAHSQAGPETGQLYSRACAHCHETGRDETRIPDRQALAQMSADSIYRVLTSGSSAHQSSLQDDAQRRAIANFLTGSPVQGNLSGDASFMKYHCPVEPLKDPLRGARWNGWGADTTNARFQPAEAAGLAPSQVARLHLKWAFAFPNATAAWAQPAVVGGRVYVGSSNGYVYSLKASNGCVFWSYKAKAGVRSAITVGPPVEGGPSQRYPIYFGDVQSNVYALDAASGKLLWMRRADDNRAARITAAPTLYRGRLYVPVSSWEATARGPDSECCKFRGSVVAYDVVTGEQAWKTYTIAENPRPTSKSASGVQQWGPSGGAVWSSPTIDAKRGVLYVGTGDSYTPPAVNTVDAVLAFDLNSGKLLWSRQLTGGDVATSDDARDYDIGSSPILRTTRDGKDILVVSSKSGVTYALDPDSNGREIWHQRVGEGAKRGGTMWGAAADAEMVYVPTVDTHLGPDKAGGLTALRLVTGEKIWHVKPPAPSCKNAREDCAPGQSAAITVIPGVVFSGSTNGVMRAYSTKDGRVLWQFDATREQIRTVNGIPGKAGSINGPGPVIVNGMLFMNSGYGYGGGEPGNLLLAFAAD